MTRTLWSGGERLSEQARAYTVGDDRVWDARLLEWDLLGTLAHLAALEGGGIVGRRDAARLRAALRRLLADARCGALVVGEDDEDVHTAVENALVARLGALGETIHSGRSRNDQVAVDLRLYLKDALLSLGASLLDAADALAAFARRHRRVVLPGYTHQRRAMPSTLGLWAAGYAELLLDDLGLLAAALDLVDRSPLGSAAGFGAPLPLDRAAAARALAFAGVQRNVTAVAASRGKLEVAALAAAWGVAHDLGKLAWDVILFTSDEFGFLVLPAGLATGSSIMPNKRNPDVFELTRARAALLDGYLAQAVALAGKLPGGYHRDLQLTKGTVMRGLDAAAEMTAMMAAAVPQLGVDRERCAAALSPEVFATDEAVRRARAGTPFRAAYREVAAELAAGAPPPALAPAAVLASRTAPGNAGNLGLAELRREIGRSRRALAGRRRRFAGALAALAGAAGRGR
jgi:argininosuccinate lyase